MSAIVEEVQFTGLQQATTQLEALASAERDAAQGAQGFATAREAATSFGDALPNVSLRTRGVLRDLNEVVASLGGSSGTAGLVGSIAGTTAQWAQMGLALGPEGAVLGGLAGVVAGLYGVFESSQQATTATHDTSDATQDLAVAQATAQTAAQAYTSQLDQLVQSMRAVRSAAREQELVGQGLGSQEQQEAAATLAERTHATALADLAVARARYTIEQQRTVEGETEEQQTARITGAHAQILAAQRAEQSSLVESIRLRGLAAQVSVEDAASQADELSIQQQAAREQAEAATQHHAARAAQHQEELEQIADSTSGFEAMWGTAQEAMERYGRAETEQDQQLRAARLATLGAYGQQIDQARAAAEEVEQQIGQLQEQINTARAAAEAPTSGESTRHGSVRNAGDQAARQAEEAERASAEAARQADALAEQQELAQQRLEALTASIRDMQDASSSAYLAATQGVGDYGSAIEQLNAALGQEEQQEAANATARKEQQAQQLAQEQAAIRQEQANAHTRQQLAQEGGNATQSIISGMTQVLAQQQAQHLSAAQTMELMLASFLQYISQRAAIEALSQVALAAGSYPDFGGMAVHGLAAALWAGVAVAAGVGGAALNNDVQSQVSAAQAQGQAQASASGGAPASPTSGSASSGGQTGSTYVINWNGPVVTAQTQTQLGRQMRRMIDQSERRFTTA